MIRPSLYPDIAFDNDIYTGYSRSAVPPVIQVFQQSGGKSLLFLGEGSIGKSTAMTILQAQLLFENIPCFLFECKYFNRQSISEIQNLEVGSGAVIIIDGFDEVKNNVRHHLLSEIRKLLEQNTQIIVTSRYNPQNFEGEEKEVFAPFKAAELLNFTNERICELVGADVFFNERYAQLLRNTMFLSMHIEFVEKGMAEKCSSEISSESAFLEYYFKMLYKQKEYGDDYETKYWSDLTSMGYYLYNRFFKNKNDDLNMTIPKELSHLFYYKDEVLYSTHLKYENFALALYMKREVTAAFSRWDMHFFKTYLEQFFNIELATDEYGVERDAAESLYYLGQMLKRNKDGISIIASMNQDDFKKPQYLFANLLCIYMGFNDDVLDDNACNIDEQFAEEILPELSHRYIMYFCKFIRFLRTQYIYDAEPLKSRMPHLLEISINNDVYKSVDNCLIVREDNSLDLACINSILPKDGSIKKILDCAFSRINGLTEVIIPNGVEQIEDSAFYQCDHLLHLEFGPDVWYVSATAVVECPKLSKLTVASGNRHFHATNNCIIDTDRKLMVVGCKNSIIPNDGSVIEISEDTYAPIDELTEFYVPEGVEVIRTEAVVRCMNLQSIYIGRDVRYIETGAICYCYKLRSIRVHAENQFYKAIDNCLVEIQTGRVILVANDAVIPQISDVKILASGAFSCWRGSVLDYDNFYIPSNITSIEDAAFVVVHGENAIDDEKYDNEIAYVGNSENPHMVTVGCHPECREIHFHKDTKIVYKLNGDYESIVIPDGILSISAGALVETTYSQLVIGKDVALIEAPLNFFDQQNVEFIISEQNTNYYVDNGCMVEKKSRRLVIGNESGYIPKGVTTIGKYAFANTYVEEMHMPSSITKIEKSAFECCMSLYELEISPNIKEIADEAFLGCSSIEELIIPEGVTSIGEAAFIGCAELKYIYLPDTVTTIKIDRYGRIPFADCDRIERISIPKHLSWLVELLEVADEVVIRE